MIVAGVWTGVGFSIWKISGPGSGPEIKSFGTGAESESEKVTPATSGACSSGFPIATPEWAKT